MGIEGEKHYEKKDEKDRRIYGDWRNEKGNHISGHIRSCADLQYF
jgi:hypothetical protein